MQKISKNEQKITTVTQSVTHFMKNQPKIKN